MHDDTVPGEKLWRIGALAEETGRSIRTLHYYEELGLLEPKVRSPGGFRLYDPTDVRRVQAISALQELDMPLERIRSLVRAWRERSTGSEAAPELRAILAAELAETRRKLTSLKEVESEIESSLQFLDECGRCADEPCRERCSDCQKGEHHGELPPFIDAFMPRFMRARDCALGEKEGQRQRFGRRE